MTFSLFPCLTFLFENFSQIAVLSNFSIFIFQIFYSGKEKKKRRDMAQGFNDLLIQPIDDLYRWSSPLTQSFNFNFTLFVINSPFNFSNEIILKKYPKWTFGEIQLVWKCKLPNWKFSKISLIFNSILA